MALLEVNEQEFLRGVHPIRLGDAPSQNTKVKVYAFPEGTDDLCESSGVISKIGCLTYRHSQRFLLAYETDAEVQPGSSGGAVLHGDSLVGIVFQAESAVQIVPLQMIQVFLEESSNGKANGVPDLGVFWQKLNNDQLRRYVAGPSKGGVLISEVVANSSADGTIRAGDVLVAIDGVEILSDASVVVDGQPLSFTHLISMRKLGSEVLVELIRSGAKRSVSVKLRPFTSMVPPPAPMQPPRYLVFCGLVFVPLTHEYMDCWGFHDAHFRFKYFYYDVLPSRSRREVVILGQVLAHEANIGYQGMHGVVVEKINGVIITRFSDIAEALQSPLGAFHVIEIDNHGRRVDSTESDLSYGRVIAFEAASAARISSEILERYGISRDRSDTL